MTLSSKTQATQATVLAALQSRGTELWWSAKQIAERHDSLAALSVAQVAAALKLLEDKGLVISHAALVPRLGRARRYDLTPAGREAQVSK